MLDDQPLAFANFGGNRQYITVGHLSENPKAFLFLMNDAHRQRVKVWGTATVVEDDPHVRRGQPERKDAMVPREHSHGQRL